MCMLFVVRQVGQPDTATGPPVSFPSQRKLYSYPMHVSAEGGAVCCPTAKAAGGEHNNSVLRAPRQGQTCLERAASGKSHCAYTAHISWIHRTYAFYDIASRVKGATTVQMVSSASVAEKNKSSVSHTIPCAEMARFSAQVLAKTSQSGHQIPVASKTKRDLHPAVRVSFVFGCSSHVSSLCYKSSI
jgi:hypothetical protein